jgi:hypothetical protein
MKRWLLLISIVITSFAFIVPARATVITYELNWEFSGAQEPESSIKPWLEATFDDGEIPGSVELKMEATNLTDAEFVGIWAFNFDPSMDPTTLTLTNVSGVNADTIVLGTDVFKADGDGSLDIKFEFPGNSANPEDRFGIGDESVWTIVGTSITASSFDFLSNPGGGNVTWATAAHVQGIGDNDEGSGWLGGHKNGDIPPVPEPATMLLFGSGLIGLAGFRRKYRKR